MTRSAPGVSGIWGQMMTKKKKKKPSPLVMIRTGGHSRPYLWAWAGVGECGRVTDGITLANGTEESHDGVWLIRFKDLEKLYRAARDYRDHGEDTLISYYEDVDDYPP